MHVFDLLFVCRLFNARKERDVEEERLFHNRAIIQNPNKKQHTPEEQPQRAASESTRHQFAADCAPSIDHSPTRSLDERDQQRMAPLMDTSALKHEGAAAVLANMLTVAATAVVAPLPFASVAAREAAEAADEADDENDDDDVLADAQNRGVLALPTVVLELVCAFADHVTLHAVEQTCGELYDVVQQSGA